MSSDGRNDPQQIKAYLSSAGEDLPDTMLESVYGSDGKEIPTLLIESAEGATTFSGLNGHPGTLKAREWIRARLRSMTPRSKDDPPR